MATVKVKFRPSKRDGEEGKIYYQVIHNHVIRHVKTDYRVSVQEWNAVSHQSFMDDFVGVGQVLPAEKSIAADVKRLEKIILEMEQKGITYSAYDVVNAYNERIPDASMFGFMRSVITQLTKIGRYRTSETYMAAFRSFSDFRGGQDVQLEAVDSDLMMMYEAFLKDRGVTKNTVSFYMRILRAVYNRAVERNLTEQQFPFKHVYTGIDKTVKRAISLGAIRKIKNLNLSPSLDFARDMFLFSFYTRGMSFIDMAYLRKSDLRNGILSYCRRKTGQQLFVCWEQCMQDIVEKQNVMEDSPYILPILKFPYDRSRTQYKNVLSRINRALKAVAQLAGIEIPLTMYVSRHSWASAAKKKHIPISVISEAMGHDSETTTQIYLASLDCSVIDRANQIILKEL